MEKFKVLIIGHQWVAPNASAAGTRMLQIIKFFQEFDYKVIFACAAHKNQYSFDFSKSNVQEFQIQLNDDSFDALLEDLQPQIVVFDRFISEEQYGWRVTKILPNALRILDTEDLHFLRKARSEAHKNNRSVIAEDFQTEVAFREIAAIYRSDISLIISKVEMKLLTDDFNISPELLFYLPLFAHEDSFEKREILPDFQQRKDVFFIGNFLHEPNCDAVLYLKKVIWPLVRQKLPMLSLNIYGAFATQKVTDLHNPKERFFVHGHAPNAEDVFLKHRLLIAPLRFGAGIKGKLIMAMETGTPSITTQIGAEGISDDAIWNGVVENNPHKFAEAIVDLYENETHWKNAKIKGFDILKSRFNPQDFKLLLLNKINKVEADLISHRQKNFIGQMLQHQSMQSTKFMSLWIQEKQKNKSN